MSEGASDLKEVKTNDSGFDCSTVAASLPAIEDPLSDVQGEKKRGEVKEEQQDEPEEEPVEEEQPVRITIPPLPKMPTGAAEPVGEDEHTLKKKRELMLKIRNWLKN